MFGCGSRLHAETPIRAGLPHLYASREPGAERREDRRMSQSRGVSLAGPLHASSCLDHAARLREGPQSSGRLKVDVCLTYEIYIDDD